MQFAPTGITAMVANAVSLAVISLLLVRRGAAQIVDQIIPVALFDNIHWHLGHRDTVIGADVKQSIDRFH